MGHVELMAYIFSNVSYTVFRLRYSTLNEVVCIIGSVDTMYQCLIPVNVELCRSVDLLPASLRPHC
jgi:hypothetical protein